MLNGAVQCSCRENSLRLQSMLNRVEKKLCFHPAPHIFFLFSTKFDIKIESHKIRLIIVPRISQTHQVKVMCPPLLTKYYNFTYDSRLPILSLDNYFKVI